MIFLYLMLVISAAFLIGFSALSHWAKYNYKKYGSLNRRQSGIGLVDKNNAYPSEILSLRTSAHIFVKVEKSGRIQEIKALDR